MYFGGNHNVSVTSPTPLRTILRVVSLGCFFLFLEGVLCEGRIHVTIDRVTGAEVHSFYFVVKWSRLIQYHTDVVIIISINLQLLFTFTEILMLKSEDFSLEIRVWVII